MKWLSSLLLIACGSYPALAPINGAIPILPGSYKVTLVGTDLGCGFLPDSAERVWIIREGYSVVVEGFTLNSSDGSYYVMQESLFVSGCAVDLDASLALTRTSFGFVGSAQLIVYKGACGSCVDHALVSGITNNP